MDSTQIVGRQFDLHLWLDLPGMLRAVIPLVRGERRRRRVVNELVAHRLGWASWSARLAGRRSGLVPGLSAVVRALDDLPEPSAGLRSVDAIGINRRAFQVIHLPSREVRAADIPFFALAIRCKNECSLARTYKNSYSTHASLLFPYLFNPIYSSRFHSPR